MTLMDLLTAALEELERPTDQATVSLWKPRLTAYANEAIADLTNTFRPWRREVVSLQNGMFSTLNLSYSCSKVLGVEKAGIRLPFYYGDSTETVCLSTVTDGTVTVVYRYCPRELQNFEDVPELPIVCHHMIVLYMVARDRSHGDASAQSGSNLRFSLYEMRKQKLRLDFDEPCGFRIYNTY